MSRFISLCIRQTMAPYTMPTSDNTTRMFTIFERNTGFAGNNGSENRKNPYVPIFSSTPARITEPAVGASVCASGSQVWNGNIGTLMAKAKKNPQKSHTFRESGKFCAAANSVGISKVPVELGGSVFV